MNSLRHVAVYTYMYYTFYFSEELAETRMTYNRYIHQINDCRQQLIDNEKELVVLEVKNENSQAAEAMQAQKVHIQIRNVVAVG